MALWAVRVIAVASVCAVCRAETSSFWLDVPFVQQEKNGCGAATIAMVMQYWERQEHGPAAPDPEAIQRALYSRQGRGIYASDLKLYLEQHGFRTFAIRGHWSDLEQNLEKGRPLIVALGSGGDLHYVVVTGMDPDREIVFKHDPARRKLLQQTRADFEREWKRTDYWTLLAVPEHDPSSSR